MTINAKIEALEYSFLALLGEVKKRHGIEPEWIFDKAEGAIMGSNGPGDPAHKVEAMEALKNLKSLLG